MVFLGDLSQLILIQPKKKQIKKFEAEHNDNKACTLVKRGSLLLNPTITKK
jgi:hypothetical protein